MWPRFLLPSMDGREFHNWDNTALYTCNTGWTRFRPLFISELQSPQPSGIHSRANMVTSFHVHRVENPTGKQLVALHASGRLTESMRYFSQRNACIVLQNYSPISWREVSRKLSRFIRPFSWLPFSLKIWELSALQVGTCPSWSLKFWLFSESGCLTESTMKLPTTRANWSDIQCGCLLGERCLARLSFSLGLSKWGTMRLSWLSLHREEQRKRGFYEFMSKLSPEAENYFKTRVNLLTISYGGAGWTRLSIL